MSIPIDEKGARYRHAVDDFERAVEAEAKAEQALQRAKAAKLTATERLHTAVQELVASEVKKALGPDGGK